MTTAENVAWAAGLFEGEGCIRWVQNRPGSRRLYVRLHVNMTDRDVLERFRAIVGGGIIFGPYASAKPSGEPAKDVWKWSATRSQDVARILSLFMPYFGERRFAKAEKAFSILADVKSRKPYAPRQKAEVLSP